VYMLVIADSEYSDYSGKMLRTKETASKEGEKSASVIGVNRMFCFGFKTKEIRCSTELIEKINKIIDDLKIDMIYTHWIYDVHQDHSAVGRATLVAGRHVPRILMYRSNWYIAASSFRGNFFVDISPYMETKIKAIKSHQTEYKKFGEKWIDFVKHQNRNSGIEMGVQYAEVFEIVKYLC
jgi:LmbE family N-acetylglucosaminyl deacetylase